MNSKRLLGFGLVSLLCGMYMFIVMFMLERYAAPNGDARAFQGLLFAAGMPAALATLFGFLLLVWAAHARIVEHKGERGGVNDLLQMYFISSLIGVVGGFIAATFGLWMPHAHTLRYVAEPVTAMTSLCTLGIGLFTLGVLFFRKHSRLVRS